MSLERNNSVQSHTNEIFAACRRGDYQSFITLYHPPEDNTIRDVTYFFMKSFFGSLCSFNVHGVSFALTEWNSPLLRRLWVYPNTPVSSQRRSWCESYECSFWCHAKQKTPLHIAVRKGNLRIIEEIASKYTEPDVYDENGVSFFAHNTPLSIAVEDNNLQIVEVLLNCSISPSTTVLRDGKPTVTPLGIAVRKGYADIVCALLRHNASFDAGVYDIRKLVLESGSREVLAALLNYNRAGFVSNDLTFLDMAIKMKSIILPEVAALYRDSPELPGMNLTGPQRKRFDKALRGNVSITDDEINRFSDL